MFPVKGKGKRYDIGPIRSDIFSRVRSDLAAKLVLQSTSGPKIRARNVCGRVKPTLANANGTKWTNDQMSPPPFMGIISLQSSRRGNDLAAVGVSTAPVYPRFRNSEIHFVLFDQIRGTYPRKRMPPQSLGRGENFFTFAQHPFFLNYICELNGTHRAKTFRRNWDTFYSFRGKACCWPPEIKNQPPLISICIFTSVRIFINTFPIDII